jgi:hypothetical protein
MSQDQQITEPIEGVTPDEQRLIVERDVHNLRGRISLGAETEEFMRTSVGQALQARAQQEMQDAFLNFTAVDPTDAKAVMEAQLKYLIPAAVLTWFADIVSDGRHAEEEFRQSDAHNGAA